MKKLAMVLLSIALVLSCTVMAFASAYVITVTDAKPGVQYNAYKVFDVTYTTPSGASEPVFTYTISDGSEWWSVVTTPATANTNVSGDPSTDDTFSVDGLTFTKTSQTDTNGDHIYLVTRTNDANSTLTDTDVARMMSEKLYANTTSKTIAATATPAAGATTASLDVGSDGYYFVTTALGALCGLTTTQTTGTVGEKNDVPEVEKQVSVDGTNFADSASATIGQTVTFKITVTDKDDTDQALTLTDTMPVGSVLVTDNNDEGGFHVSVKPAGGTAASVDTLRDDAEGFTITTNANHRDFTITFTDDFMRDQVHDGDEIIITYLAALTTDAEIAENTNGTGGTEAYNDNEVVLTYVNQQDTDTARLFTYEMDMVKVDDDNNKLTGAEFTLWDAATGGNQIYLTKDTTASTADMNVYIVDPDATAATTDTIEAGLVRFVGLGEGNYYLEETQAPTGYNELTARELMPVPNQNYHVTLTQADKWQSGYKVVNHNGSILPSTGGIGTYLFYGIGAILVVGAVVVLVSKKRMHAYGE